MFDTHCHLDGKEYDDDLPEVFTRAKAAGFTHFMIPGIDFQTTRKIQNLAETYENVYFAAGIHPNNCGSLPEDWLSLIEADTYHPKCKAIGEVGMDFHWDFCPKDLQREVFTKQLELAEKRDLPVIIHCREAYEILWPILSAWLQRPKKNRAVLHAFDEDAEKALLAVNLGCMLGIGGTYTYPKKNDRRLEILRAVPIEAILLETDSPYLTPHPHRGTRNEPAYARLTLQKIADIKGLTLDEADLITSDNAFRFYKIDSGGSVSC